VVRDGESQETSLTGSLEAQWELLINNAKAGAWRYQLGVEIISRYNCEMAHEMYPLSAIFVFLVFVSCLCLPLLCLLFLCVSFFCFLFVSWEQV
jgi:hypothetical protein